MIYYQARRTKMKAEDLINNNALTNIEVTGRDTVVYTGIALTDINMTRMEERKKRVKMD